LGIKQAAAWACLLLLHEQMHQDAEKQGMAKPNK
jgi:hypothetical protein